MTKRATNASGILLLVIGGLALLHTTLLPWLGWDFGLWRFWPMLLGVLGLALMMAALGSGRRGLQPLFIPGVPITIVSALLLWSSVFDSWGLWEVFWPMIILGQAFGFFLTAITMRVIWFMIPAIIVGMNGLILQFCAITGWWDAWSILWTLEPLAVGLALLVASGGHRKGLMRAGLILTAVSAVFFSLMSFLLSGWVSVLAALALIGGGVALLVRPRGNKVDLLEEKAPKEKLYDIV